MTSFIPGIELSRNFYEEVVRKLVEPPHAAAVIGEGSEVLGFDQPRSTDIVGDQGCKFLYILRKSKQSL